MVVESCSAYRPEVAEAAPETGVRPAAYVEAPEHRIRRELVPLWTNAV